MNSYSASGRALPDAFLERVASVNSSDALNALCDLLALEVGSQKFELMMLDGGGYFLCLSPPG